MAQPSPPMNRRRATIPPIATPRALSHLLVSLLWIVPVLFFGYHTVVDRWAEGDRALAEAGHGSSLVVGVSIKKSLTGEAAGNSRSQAYLAWPDSLLTLDAYAVAQDSHGTRVSPIRFGFPIFAGAYGVWIAGSVWYLIKRNRS